ncbi:hypothetical protein ACLOJK_013648 [Asimina triloba]
MAFALSSATNPKQELEEKEMAASGKERDREEEKRGKGASPDESPGFGIVRIGIFPRLKTSAMTRPFRKFHLGVLRIHVGSNLSQTHRADVNTANHSEDEQKHSRQNRRALRRLHNERILRHKTSKISLPSKQPPTTTAANLPKRQIRA